MANRNQSIKKQLLPPLTIGLMFLVISFALIVFNLQKLHLESKSSSLLESAINSFEIELEVQKKLLKSLQIRILEEQATIEALSKGEREKLYALNKDFYRRFNVSHRVTHFYFHSVVGVNVVRIHHPERFGDIVNRFTMNNSLQMGKETSGIELGALGVFTLRVVKPVFKDKTLVGYLELGKEIEGVVKKIEASYDVDAVLLIDKSFLNRGAWQSGMTIVGRQSDWDLMQRHVISYPSSTKLRSEFQDVLQNISTSATPLQENVQHSLRVESKQQSLQLRDLAYLLIQMPLIDAGNNHIGEFLLIQSDQYYQQQLKKLAVLALLSVISVGAILLFILRRLLSKADALVTSYHQNLSNSQSLLMDSQRIAKIGSWVLDHTTKKLEWSDETFNVLGISSLNFEVSYQAFLECIHPEDRELVAKAYQSSLETQSGYSVSHRVVMPDGSIKYVQERCETEFDKQGNPLVSRGTVQDITDLVEAEKALHDSEHQHKALLNNTSAVIYMKDLDGRYLFINRMFEELFKLRNDEVVGKTDFELFPLQVATAFRDNDCKVAETGETLEIEEVAPLADGEHTYISIKFPVKDSQGNIKATCGISTDITERIRAQEKILHQAHYDSLTDLPNRFLVLDRLGQLFEKSKRNDANVAVIFLDLDDFKKINDSMGHEAGDRLLVESAARLKRVIRLGDTVGRLGGDEFIVLLNNLNKASDARPVVESLLRQFRKPFVINDRELILTCTVGVSIYPNDGDTPSELLRKADSAMYHAKDAGRNTYAYFTESMNKGISRRLEIEEQLHGALEREEFSVYYQAKIDVGTELLVGAEALLRWRSEKLGNIPPDEFISIAEQTGDIVPIGKYVLNSALALSANLKKLYGEYVCLAVNLSPCQFRDPELVVFIQESLKKFEVPPQYLELEITEGVLMSGHQHVSETLNALNQLGVTLSMDDFGTGYSSLSYLRKYPFDSLKIDRSFVNDIVIDKADRELVGAAIAMSHALGLSVVAEGVENAEQYELLKQLKCDYAQGYYFARPEAESHFIDYFQKHLLNKASVKPS